MMKKPFSGVRLILPGFIFVALGILVVVEPRILVWLVAAAFILIGVMLVMMAGLIRKAGRQHHDD